MLNAFSYIFFIVFLLTAALHLYFAFKEEERARKITKPFCLFFLVLAVLVTVPTAPLIYVGATLGLIGDILLLKNKDRKYFIPGALFFLFGHFLYISALIIQINKVETLPTLFYMLAPAALLLFSGLGYSFSYKLTQDKLIALIGSLYLGVLIFVSVISLVGTVKGNMFMLFSLVGGLSFLVSDLLLTQATFLKDYKRRDFYIMLTYLLGQALIVIGLVWPLL